MNALDASQDHASLDVAANGVRTTLLPAATNDADGRSGSGTARGIADWLGLAAAPTFAVMALLAAVAGGSPAEVLCGAAREASPLAGMVPMYILMSAFHAAPWLRLCTLPRSTRKRC